MTRKSKSVDIRSKIAKALTKPQRKSRAKFKPFQRAARKAFRHAIALLKKAKVIPKTVDARKVVPSSGLRKVIRKNRDVIKGEAKTYKVEITAAQKKQLEDLGYRFSGKKETLRVVAPKGQRITKRGEVKIATVAGRPGGKLKVVRLRFDDDENPEGFEGQIRKALEGMKQGDFVAFQVNGQNSFDIYASPEEMILNLHEYIGRGFKFTNLAVFTVDQKAQADYIKNSENRRTIRQRERKKLRARERKAFRAGMRVSRGH